MEIKIIKNKISSEEAKRIADKQYGDMFKAVIDIEKEIMAAGGELHSDASEVLLKNGSDPKNLWGINIYPDNSRKTLIEFNSLINIRPLQNNRSMDIESEEIKEKIRKIVNKLIS